MFDDAAMAVMEMPAAQSFAPMPVMAPARMTPDLDDGVQADLEANTLHEEIKNSELQIIMSALKTTCSRMEAAKKLGISPRTLRYKLAKLKENGHEMAWLN